MKSFFFMFVLAASTYCGAEYNSGVDSFGQNIDRVDIFTEDVTIMSDRILVTVDDDIYTVDCLKSDKQGLYTDKSSMSLVSTGNHEDLDLDDYDYEDFYDR